MALDTFARRSDLVEEVNRLGMLYDIRHEFMCTQHVYMLCCSSESKCEARILGMYSQQDKMFHIRRLESIHCCTKSIRKESALQYEIQKPRYAGMRLGQIVETIFPKFKVGYCEVFKACWKAKGESTGAQKENSSNTMRNLIESPSSLASGLGIKSMLMHCLRRDDQESENLATDCLHSLKSEFESLNRSIRCSVPKSGFFFKHAQMGDHLRSISELKVYTTLGRTVVLGLLFDPWDDHIIQSCLVSDEPKARALEAFIDCDLQVSGPGYQQFFIIDLDGDVMETLRSKGVSFFIKSRSVSSYLRDSKENDLEAFEHFAELNYGNRELLDIEKSLYLKRHCPKKMFNLNNAHAPDFEFVTPAMLSLPLVDCITALIWLVYDDLRTRKTFTAEDLEGKLPESIVDFIEECSEANPRIKHEVSLEDAYCGCGKFQENLFPCIHAHQKIRDLGLDPLMYVSSVYSKDNLLKISDILPVINIRVHHQKTKAMLKKRTQESPRMLSQMQDGKASPH